MSAIVERMARTYCAAEGSEPDWFMRDETGTDVPVWTDRAIGIRAALRSVRPEDVNDAMVRAFRRVEHEICCAGAALDDICNIPPIVERERRAIAAAIAKGAE